MWQRGQGLPLCPLCGIWGQWGGWQWQCQLCALLRVSVTEGTPEQLPQTPSSLAAIIPGHTLQRGDNSVWKSWGRALRVAQSILVPYKYIILQYNMHYKCITYIYINTHKYICTHWNCCQEKNNYLIANTLQLGSGKSNPFCLLLPQLPCLGIKWETPTTDLGSCCKC